MGVFGSLADTVIVAADDAGLASTTVAATTCSGPSVKFSSR
jgi:hypothetical protein